MVCPYQLIFHRFVCYSLGMKIKSLVLLLILSSSLLLSGCAAALIGAGAVGGYAVAKDMENGKLIDTKKK